MKEKITLIDGHGLWTKHLTDWLWLIDSQKALLFNIITFRAVGLIVGYWVGHLWEVWD